MRGSARLVLTLAAAGCAGMSGPGPPPAFDPTGIYDVTMASQGLVSEGTMTIRGVPGAYRGELSAGGVSADIRSVDVGDDNMAVRAETTRGMLILRLLKDGETLSGNWVLGDRRGTFAAERRTRHDPASAYPLLPG